MAEKRKCLFAVICIVVLLSSTVSFAANSDLTTSAVRQNELPVSIDKIRTKNITSQSVTGSEQIVPGKLVVKFKDGNVAVQKKAFLSVGNNIITSFESTTGNGVALVNLAENANINEAMELISKQPNVEFVEPLYIYKAFDLEYGHPQTVTEATYETVTDAVYGANDPYYQKKWQWGLQAINVTDIWERVPVEKRSDITIAVIDTGVDLDHPDLKDNIVAGYDFVNEDNVPDDDHGHGTHVAGIAAAITNNEVGIAGVAGGAKIMPVKVLSAEGSGTSLDVYLGITYAVNNGADVINMSLGSDAPSLLVKEAVEYALQHNVVVVAATGNDSRSEVSFPAAFDGVIGVGAVDYYGGNIFKLASFSNFGPETDIVAPGVNILSTYPVELDTFDGLQDGYTLFNGTSMATPFVAGMAALLKAEKHDLSYNEIQKALKDNAYDIYEKGWDVYTGAGVVNGSTGEVKIPDIFEFHKIYIDVNRDSRVPTAFQVFVVAEKANGIIDDSFNGEVNVNLYRYLSNPVSDYYYYIRALTADEYELQANYRSMTETGNSIAVPIVDGIGYEIYNIEKSGFYNFTIDSETAPEDYLVITSNSIYRVQNNDVCVSGNIRLEEPFDKDMKILIFAVNEIYSLYIEANLAFPIIVTVPAGETNVPYTLYLPRDMNYKVYYGIIDDNDIYHNYGFYKTSSVTTLDPNDFSPVDLTEESATGIDLNINTVEDLPDDVGDTREEALELILKGLEPGEGYERELSLEYKGDRDFFKADIEKEGKYAFIAFPNNQYLNPRITVYDSSGNIIVSDIAEVISTLKTGTYYIKVEDETGIGTGIYYFMYGRPAEKIETPEPAVIEFEDENLANAIRNLLGKTVSEAVYDDEVYGISILDLSSLNISSVKGLEYFENLNILDISGNNITDLSPLSNLYRLEELDASNNRISELPKDLSRLYNIYHLDLSNNKITDISPLATLASEMESLFLQDNNITDISALSHLDTLQVLYLNGNPVTDYSPVIPYYLNLRDKDFFLPAAENVAISGNNKVGSVLTGSYTYVNVNNHPEKGTTFRWLRAASKDGEYVSIPGAVSKTYTLTQNDLGKYIKFEVTPVADGVPSKGVPVTSPAFGPIEDSSGGGGSSGGGSRPRSGSDSGSGSGSNPVTPTQAPAQNAPVKEVTADASGKKVLTVDASNLQLSWDTAPAIDAMTDSDVDAAEIKLSADILRESLRHNQPFSIVLNNVTFRILPGTIAIPEDAESVLLKVYYSIELPASLKPADTKGVSLVYDFGLTVDGKAVTSFEKPVVIILTLINVNNPDKTGVYCFNEEDGSWIFMGGKVNEDGTITFSAPHFSKFQAMESTRTFSDIQDHWAKEDIETMAARHVTYGTGDNKFNPDMYITRAEFTAMIVRALNINEQIAENPFGDVKSGDWFADTAMRANAAGIIQGDANGYFMPGNMITREEMAAIIVRAYSYYSGENLNKIITTQEVRFKDMDNASEWARKSITLADALGLMNGMPDKTFRPKSHATRAEAVVVVKRLMKLLGIF